MDTTGERFCKLEDRFKYIIWIQCEQYKRESKRHWGRIEKTNLHLIWDYNRENVEGLFEMTTADNFSELLKDIKPQVQKLQPVTNKINDK